MNPVERDSGSRLTLGFLTSRIGDGTGRKLWTGINEICQKNGINLVSFTGSELDAPGGFSRQANMIYDLVDRGQLDGLVVWASSLATYVGLEAIQQFCERYRPLPLVAIGLELAGIPSIVLDSYQGERDAVIHLVEVHGRRRIAYIRGPERHNEASLRYLAYQNVVREYGLATDPGLVTPPLSWDLSWGREAARLLVEERGQTFDAIASVNDTMAVGAMEYLQERGIRVPEDVSIVGFGNGPEGRVLTPPLTTVPIRMTERGRQAVRMLLAQVAGEAVPGLVTLPTHLLLRQSCGCPDPLAVEAGLPAEAGNLPGAPAGWVEAGGTWQERISARRGVTIAELEHVLDLDEPTPGWAGELFDALVRLLEQAPAQVFPTTLQRLLNHSTAADGEMIAWQKVISVLRARILPLLRDDPQRHDRAERYLHQARVMIGERALRAQGYLDWKSSQQVNLLMRVRQRLSGAQSVPELADILARDLPEMGIRRCYLALYQDAAQPLQGARLALAYDETRRYTELEGQVVTASWQLMPAGIAADAPQNLVVVPLYYRDEQLGFILIDGVNLQGSAHQLLCEQISSALKSVRLIEQNVRLYHQALEGQRMAEEANLLKSRFLSMVSHELLTPMVLLVGLSEMMLHEGIGDRTSLPEPYRQDLTRIHAGAQQLGSLVRDVLDLARSQLGQLKLARKPLDLAEMLKPVALVGEQMAISKGLAWRAEIPAGLPRVMGDSARLQQVALNLVNNAIKFTAQGSITLRVALEGESVTVFVQDTGLGVPLGEQEAIFDEFRQSERSLARGYGGLGIGLAICRQLIELHDGRIGVQSSGEENGGSTFYFNLPVMEEEEIPRLAYSSQVVLLLTSRAGQAGLLQDHLLKEGFQVEVVGVDETPDWLAGVLAAPPGAVVLDVPAAERGWELMGLLKGNPATQDIPLIYYSLLQEQGGGSILALDYLAKPLAGSALSRALERYGLGAAGNGSGYTVLVADDDPDILDLHARLVAQHIPNSRVLRASNGRLALEQMRQTIPSLVLLDLMMPELDGAGVLKGMQEDSRLRDVPVIVLTAQTLSQDEMEGLNQGVAAVLAKGVFTNEETLTHIDRALARSKRLGSDSQRLVRKVMAYIHEHYTEPLSRQEMAAYAGVSERHLNRCFLQETEISPVAYLNRYRIHQAKGLLREGRQNITEVMGEVGFSDSSYFTRVFRREVGVSPRDFQRKKA